MGDQTEKENKSRADEAKAKEKGEGLGKRDAQGNLIEEENPEVNNDLPEPQPPTPTQLPS